MASKYPTQAMMEENIMSGGKMAGLVSANQNSRPATLAKSKTGSSDTHTKVGGKKEINVNKKMKKVMKKAGLIK